MSQYPVEDNENLFQAVNYLLSGPSGLGQNFSGFSAYKPAYLTGFYRQPFSISTTATSVAPTWYSSATIANITPLNVNTATNLTDIIQVDFDGTYDPQPFIIADAVSIEGVIDADDSGFYDDYYSRSVMSCDNTSTVIRTNSGAYEWPAYVSGGVIYKDYSNQQNSTDANAKVTVSGPTDQVFISCQLNLDFTYMCSMASEFDIVVQVNRYYGVVDQAKATQGSPEYLFVFDGTVSEKIKHYSVDTSGSVADLETIFTSVFDTPSFGYYWYICEITFNTKDPNNFYDPYPGDAKPGVFTVGIRSLTAQVVKQ